MDVIDMMESRRFLGNEFLMWLWFKADCYDSLLTVADHGEVEVVFDDSLRLEAYLAETERNDLKGGAPAYSPEAKTALRQGKRISKVKLRIVKEGREWVFTVKAESLELGSIKIPAVLSRDEDDQFYERMYLLEELEEIFENLFKEFLGLRLDNDWHEVWLPAMKDWVRRDDLSEPKHYPVAS